jgi:hypothetical protein
MRQVIGRPAGIMAATLRSRPRQTDADSPCRRRGDRAVDAVAPSSATTADYGNAIVNDI